MAEPSERTALLDPRTDDGETAYLNLDYNTVRLSTSSREGIENNFGNLDEFLYRLQYAFLSPGYDVEADLRQVIQYCNGWELDQLLQSLSATPLPIKQKIQLARIIHSEGKLQRRYHTGTTRVKKKQSPDSVLRRFHLWEDTITKLTAYFGSNVASYFRFVRTLVYLNIFMAVILMAFVTLPELVEGNLKSNITFGGHFGDLSDSIMFYGLYTPDIDSSYNLPMAYFLTWVIANILCFIYIVTIMIIRYKNKKLSEDKTSEYKFSWRTFCMWDHSITSRQGVIDHRTSLRTDIKEIIKEEQSQIEESLSKRCGKYIARLFCNAIVLLLLVGSGLLIYEVAESDQLLPNSAPDSWKDFFRKYQLTAVVAGLKFLIPPIFQQIVSVEGWHPRIETKITLARTTLFYIASLVVFLYSLYDITDDCQAIANNTTMTKMSGNESCCWENEVGEEVFKVILFDLGLLVIIGLVVHFIRATVVKCFCKYIGYSKFDVVSCVLDVIYGQSLVWMGLYFSPLLALIGLAKLIVVFYIRYLIAKVAMVPPQQMFRASSTGNFYLAILLLNMFVSIFPMAYAVIEFNPSPDCGPFKKFEYPYKVIGSKIGDLPDWLESFLHYLGTTAVLIPILVLLIICALYFKVKSSSYNSQVTELRRQLKFERKVEKRKIFATGRAMSSTTLSQYSAPNSPALSTRDRPYSQHQTQQPIDTIDEVEEEIYTSI